jgi:hypothetical protein
MRLGATNMTFAPGREKPSRRHWRNRVARVLFSIKIMLLHERLINFYSFKKTSVLTPA